MTRLDKLLHEQNELKVELIEKVRAVEAGKWTRMQGVYAVPNSLEGTCTRGSQVNSRALFTYLGPYLVLLREGAGNLKTLSFFEDENYPQLHLDGEEVIKLYNLKEQEVSAYEEGQCRKRQLQNSSGRLQTEIDLLKSILDKI